MRQLFNLRVAPERKRADVDAFLEIAGERLDFELKSTTGKSFSTVRDFGPDHLEKWRRGLHWIFAVYDKTGTELRYCYYASPADMEPWFTEKERYIAPDFALARALPDFASEAQVTEALGAKDSYDLSDAKRVLKNHWKNADYERAQDLPEGYSLERMTELMRERAQYVLSRGATLNNPHIPLKYFESFDVIAEEHASRLRELVTDYLMASASDEATA